jgi:hypothetical protein
VQQLVQLVREVEQLELAAAVRHGRVRADQLADARRVDRRDAGEVEEDVRPAAVDGGRDHLAQLRVAGADRDLPLQGDDLDVFDGAVRGLHDSFLLL